MKQQTYEVNDLTNNSRYFVTSWKQGRDETDRSAIKSAIEHDDVITMGKVIVSPVK